VSPSETNTSSSKPRFPFWPSKQSATARDKAGNNGLGFRREATVVDDVAIVIVVTVVEPDGVNVAGEKLQAAPAGNPEQLNVIGEAKEFSGVTMTVVVPLCPGVMSSDAEESAMLKVGAGRFSV
jgi:hypothetical protein